MNFNDFFSSLNTLFALMVVNNWMVIVEMYVSIMGSANYRYFFCFFYYFATVMGINILVAFSLDMYSSVERMYGERLAVLKMMEDEMMKNLDEAVEVSDVSSEEDG
jgi:hypothetical protein